MSLFQLVTIACTICRVLAASEFGNLVTTVTAELNTLKSRVDSWSAERGLAGALGIQGDVQPLVANVNNLRSLSRSVDPADVDPNQLKTLVTSIVGVLQSIQNKEGDFTRLGLRQIVGNDIRNIETPTIDIISSLITVLGADCSKLESVAPLVSEIEKAFNSVDQAFGVQATAFPKVPACQRRTVVHVAQPRSTAPNQPAGDIAPLVLGPATTALPLYSSIEGNQPQLAPPGASALNHTNATIVPVARNDSTGATYLSSPKAPAVVGPFLGNNTQLIPMLSNAAASAKIGLAAAGAALAVAARAAIL